MLDFYKGKSVFITGHTGFKGSWLCRILHFAQAQITGYALPPEIGGMFEVINNETEMTSVFGDIRNYSMLSDTFSISEPEIVLHLAAQPLVLDAYERPSYTFETNVQGTVNLLECVRQSESVRSVVIITTDKVYRNNEWAYGYRETDILGGNEPYSASKACTELVAEAYTEAFLRQRGITLSTVRAGNVVGGGDLAKNRIIPDCIRSSRRGEPIIVRNPHSIRPYQHVLEPLFAYLLIAHKQYENVGYAGCYNIGPNETDCIATAELADMFCQVWGNNQSWQCLSNIKVPHEAGLLKLDCAKMRSTFGWRPVWSVSTAITKTVEWEKSENKLIATDNQINEYMKELKC